ncbi:pentatricopeptide repeat-containing protein At5g13770, chloroplastic [Syzygium oleosum]|uniref:pentatricopeptide repeat-containing protein At5g13770, chloroplastic n=1 Tax=Syzygium oleosum TaxID=219896 RepID=UPI0011D22CB9|nr:pentatricopeptide repeat-containing protein At5g13770, chloroplastic [Syzygium oleosum]XP_056166151.1 pentatricopeptide repeat-containing protein At5g13770, chloroplastic [Syzygium oleosum]
MAILSSPEKALLASIGCCRELHRVPFTRSCKTLLFPSLRLSNLGVSCSNCPSTVLEEPSGASPSTRFDLQAADSLQGPTTDSESFNRFLRGLFEAPETEKFACEYYEKAKESPNFEPEKSTLDGLARYLIREKKWDFIAGLSYDFMVYNVFPDKVTCARLVSNCIEARKFRVVDGILEVLGPNREAGLFAFNTAMRGYNKLHMYSSTIVVHERMKSIGVALDPGCYYTIMEAHMKIGDVTKVVELFREFESRRFSTTSISTRVFGVVCESLCKSRRAFEALEYFKKMKNSGIAADTKIYTSLISSFASIGEIKVAEQLFKEASEEKILLRDPDMFLKLVLMYIEEGLLEKTFQVIEAMKGMNLKVSDCILCAIVNGFSKKRGSRAAVRVYGNLISRGCKPGQVTYASVLSAYCRVGLYSRAEALFSEMETKGYDKCVVAYSSMVAMYGKRGKIREAMKLVAKMKARGCKPNVWVYNTLMEIHGRAKNLRQVDKIWKEMKRKKVAPDKVSYTSLIAAYNRAREFEMCIKFYEEFRANGGSIDRAMGGIMVGVFSKSSRIDELIRLLQDMKSEGTELDGRLYGSALNALKDAGLLVQASWFQESFGMARVRGVPS